MPHRGAQKCAEASNRAPGNLRRGLRPALKQLRIVDSAVFWPAAGEPFFELTGVFPFPSSDHRLVWVNVMVPGR